MKVYSVKLGVAEHLFNNIDNARVELLAADLRKLYVKIVGEHVLRTYKNGRPFA